MKFSLKRNLIIFVLAGVLPEIVIYFYNATHYNDFRFTLQYMVDFFSLALIGYLLISNSMGLSKSKDGEKIGRWTFILLSILFLLYVGLMLFAQLTLSHIGF